MRTRLITAGYYVVVVGNGIEVVRSGKKVVGVV